MKTKIIGSVAVDSGGLIIVDPAYLGEWKDGEYGDDNHYTKACEARDDDKDSSIVVAGLGGNAVCFGSGYGDGIYPVTAHYDDNGCVMKVVIDMEGLIGLKGLK